MWLQTTVIEEDREFVHSYFDMPDEDFPIHRQSPWLLRITLNRDLMVDKKLSLEAIAERINTEFEDELHCIFNDDNAEVPALRVRHCAVPMDGSRPCVRNSCADTWRLWTNEGLLPY